MTFFQLYIIWITKRPTEEGYVGASTIGNCYVYFDYNPKHTYVHTCAGGVTHQRTHTCRRVTHQHTHVPVGVTHQHTHVPVGVTHQHTHVPEDNTSGHTHAKANTSAHTRAKS